MSPRDFPRKVPVILLAVNENLCSSEQNKANLAKLIKSAKEERNWNLQSASKKPDYVL